MLWLIKTIYTYTMKITLSLLNDKILRMHLSFLFLTMLLGVSCQSGGDAPNETKDNDTGVSTNANSIQRQSIINRYYAREKSARDSITKYQLDSIYDRCLRLLYGIYGKEKITDITTKRSTTVGESDIRLYGFKYETPIIRRIDFEVFWNDSLPINATYSFD